MMGALSENRQDGLVRMLLPPVEADTVLILRERGHLTPQDISKELNKSPHQINVTLGRLGKKGFVSLVGKEEAVTKSRYVYEVNDKELKTALDKFMSDYRLSDEAPEAAAERMRNYEWKRRDNFKASKPIELESEEAAEKFYNEALLATDKATKIDLLNRSILCSKLTQKTFEEAGDNENASRMQMYEIDKSLFLSKLTQNTDLVHHIQDESRDIIKRSHEAENIQAAQKILRESSEDIASWESIMEHRKDDIIMLRDVTKIVGEYSPNSDIASKFKYYVDRVSEEKA